MTYTYKQQAKFAAALGLDLLEIPSLSDQLWGQRDSGDIPGGKGIGKSYMPHHNSLENLKKNDYWKGKKQPTEMIEKRRQSMIGHVVSDETRQKISAKAKSYKHMLGKKHSEETKQKMREASRRRWGIK